MDDLDARLLTELARDARLPVATLARRLGVARSTLQARIDRLEATGAIAGYTIRTARPGDARRIRATALLQVEPRATAGVLRRLEAVAEVERAVTTSGRFDLALTLAADTTEALDRALDAIGAIPGVTDSESLVHLSTRIDRG